MVTWLHEGIADGAGIPGRGSPSPLREAIHAAILAAGALEPGGLAAEASSSKEALREAIRTAAVQEGLGKDPLREASSSSRAPKKPRRSVGLANAAVLAAVPFSYRDVATSLKERRGWNVHFSAEHDLYWTAFVYGAYRQA